MSINNEAWAPREDMTWKGKNPLEKPSCCNYPTDEVQTTDNHDKQEK